jgi:hypothetical protein
MLNSGKKIRALRDNKINILTLVLSEKKILNETKNHNPPLQVKWSVPYIILTDLTCYFLYSHETNLDNYQVDNTRVRIFILLSRKARIFFPEFNIRLYDKNSESNFFFPPP